MSHTSYLGKALDAKAELFPTWERALRDYERIHNTKPEFDFLAGTGLSGTLSLAAMRFQYNFNISIVRRDPEGYKEWKPIVEDTFDDGYYARRPDQYRWLLIDDCIGGGNTLRRVWRTISEAYPRSVCVGAFLFDWGQIMDRNYVRVSAGDELEKRYDLETEILNSSRSIRAPSFGTAKEVARQAKGFWEGTPGTVRPAYSLGEMEDLVSKP